MNLNEAKQILNSAGYICESVSGVTELEYFDLVVDWIRRLNNTTHTTAKDLAYAYAESVYENYADGIDAQETAQEIIDSENY